MEQGPSEKKKTSLDQRLKELGIKKEDIDIKCVRSGGHGGQNVNKVATCVYVKHLPTGLAVKCSEARTQALNRFLAIRRLADKIESTITGKDMNQDKIEKIRKNKKRRARRSKKKIT
jgi:protein subunit release factor B